MKITKTNIEKLLILEPDIYNDTRGYFFECYNKKTFEKNNIHYNFVQENQSLSQFGTIRGLHFQKSKHSQAKLVRVIKGTVVDTVVDLRKESKTFGKTFSIELSSENNKQLLIPRGFAHGFSVLSKTAILNYKCDNFYNKKSEYGILYNDKDLKIDWKIPSDKVIISDKDKKNKTFKEFVECI